MGQHAAADHGNNAYILSNIEVSVVLSYSTVILHARGGHNLIGHNQQSKKN